MVNYDRIANRIFKSLKGHGYDIKMYTTDGTDTVNPDDGRRFFVEEPNLMITLDEATEEIVFNKNTNVPLSVYESVLQQIKQTANHYMLNFTLKEFGKQVEPKDFSYQAKNVKESRMKQEKEVSSVTESSLSKMFGSKKTSRQTLEDVQILVKHKTAVDEEVRGSRARNIHSIFLECGGERFRFPHKHLGGARAMARHMSMGGNMGDMIGEHIVTSTENMIKLKEFMRYVRNNKLISEDTNDVVSLVKENVRSISTDLKRLAGAKSYGIASARIAESQSTEELNEDDITKFRDMFTVKRFDEKYSEVLPLVGKLVTEQESYLRRIEESASNPVMLEPAFDSALSASIQYESKIAEVGNKIKALGLRISENNELASYISSLGDKMISETQLSEFEQTIISSVFEHAVDKVVPEAGEGLIAESFKPFEKRLEKYDHIFLV